MKIYVFCIEVGLRIIMRRDFYDSAAEIFVNAMRNGKHGTPYGSTTKCFQHSSFCFCVKVCCDLVQQKYEIGVKSRLSSANRQSYMKSITAYPSKATPVSNISVVNLRIPSMQSSTSETALVIN